MPNFSSFAFQKIIYYILLLIVFMTPLVGFQPNLGYEGAKVLFFYLAMSVCVLLWFILSFKNPIKILNSSIFKMSSLFLLSLLTTSLLGINAESSLIGKYPYYQGFILYAFLFFFYILISTLQVKLKDIAIALSTSAALVSFLAIKQFVELHFLDINLPTYAGRVVSTFGQPNLYSGFLLLTLPFSYLLLKDHKLRPWAAWSGVVSIAAILASQSRAAILLLVVLLIVWLLSMLSVGKRVTFSIVTVVILASLFVSINLSTGIIWEEIQAPINNQWLIDNSPEKRIYVWQIIGHLILSKPLLGYGLENITPTFSSYFNGFNINTLNYPAFHALKNLSVDRSHNYSLDLLMFSGILGLLAWILLIRQLFKKVRSKVLLVSVVVYIIWIQLQIQSIVHLMYFWLLVGFIDQGNHNDFRT